MDKRLHDILTDQEDNYMLPFYWQRGDHTETIPEEIARIAASGCRAFCVESRPHPDFVGERWWRDMDIILEEADKRGMKVWLLDDDRFPTGHAAGMIAKKHPELRQWVLTERHIDVVGKMEGASILVDPENEDKRLIGVYAYRRRLDDEEITEGEGIDLFACLNGRYLSWDIPEGAWRIFFYYQSRRGGRAEYIDMLNRDSVRVLIDAVYESHFARYGKYFGNTFAGFFSDEPCFGNGIFAEERFSHGLYEMRIGKPAMALPYHQTVRERMANALGFDPLPYFNLLWYEDNENGALQAKLRYHYMDTITAMYRENFTKQLADWCASHGVEYIGHIIEDMNCRLGCGAGHYFRALDCQHMSGIDVVLHQIMPGMEDFTHTASVSWGVTRGTFFHYVLAKLGASLAHLTPHMKKRAMCEVFGAYGYGEDSVMMKYLIDHLLVRGINHFVPHAFSSRFPDGDCPPHFGVKGIDPSYEAFSKLVTYTNKVSHLFLDSTHIASAAVFYHAEGEWTSRFQNAATMEPIAKTLYDAHIDFDIVSYDMLKAAKVENKKLKLSDESFECLVIYVHTERENTHGRAERR